MGKLLTGKKILVMGVANQRSIAWGCAQVMAEQGAELIYTYQNERMKKSVAKLVKKRIKLRKMQQLNVLLQASMMNFLKMEFM